MALTSKKILVILTGGTICSSVNENNERFSDAENVRIVSEFKKGDSPCASAEFESVTVLDILSENMTVAAWNTLLCMLRKTDFKKYCGIIMLHGTDTLAFTSSLLSLVLAGCDVPVFTVSAQLPLSEKASNGHANFRVAVELIKGGIAPNVYTVYRNSDGEIYLHYGAHLLQCANYSNDFFSCDMMKAKDGVKLAKGFETDSMLIDKFDALLPCVTCITPYVGLNYKNVCLDGVRAVVHGTYHSDTVCVERRGGRGEVSDFSVLSLIKRCRNDNIPVFLAPCDGKAYHYESTGDAIENGAYCISGTTFETAYVKTLVGCAMGCEGEELCEFINKSVNHEIIHR